MKEESGPHEIAIKNILFWYNEALSDEKCARIHLEHNLDYQYKHSPDHDEGIDVIANKTEQWLKIGHHCIDELPRCIEVINRLHPILLKAGLIEK